MAVPAGGRSGFEDCVICLDTLLQPQTMPCGHHFCRGCVASMRKHGVGEEQVCPLCRGPMPDAERLSIEASVLLAQFDKWDGRPARAVKKTGSSPRKTQPAWVRQLLRRAVALYQQALAIDDAQPNWHSFLAGALVHSGDKDGALCAYRRAIDLGPADAFVLSNYGIALWWKDEPGGPTVNVAGAEAAFRAAVNAAPTPDVPGCAWAHFNLGTLLYTRNDLDGAEAAWRVSLAADPSSSAHFQLGCIASARQDYDGAARLFATAHQLDPTDANAKLQMEKNLQAARTVRAAAKQRSDQNDQLRRIGEALFRPQHGDDWESAFERIKGEEMQYCREHGFDTTGFE